MSDDESAIEPEEEKDEPQRSLAELLQKGNPSQLAQKSQIAGQPALDVPSLHLGTNQLESDRYSGAQEEEVHRIGKKILRRRKAKVQNLTEKYPRKSG